MAHNPILSHWVRWFEQPGDGKLSTSTKLAGGPEIGHSDHFVATNA